MNYEQMRKVLATLKLKQDRAMTRTQNDLLIRYFQWTHVEKRERRVIYTEEYDLNSINSTYCAYKSISDNVVDELITTDINTGDLTDFYDNASGRLIDAINCDKSTESGDTSISNDAADGLIYTDIEDVNSTDGAEYYAGGLIGAINSGYSMNCDDIKVSCDAAGGLIDITINAGILTDCFEGATVGSINAIDAVILMNSTDKSVSGNAADGLIATLIDADGFISTPINSTDNAHTNVSDKAIDKLMMLMC